MKQSSLGKCIVVGIGVLSNLQMVHAQQCVGSQVQVNWSPASDYNGKDNLNLRLVLKNISNKSVDLQQWNLWFNSIFPVIEKQTAAYVLSNEMGNLFKIQFNNQVVNPNDSLEFIYQSKFPIASISIAPNGFYFQDKSDVGIYCAVNKVVYSDIVPSKEKQLDYVNTLYTKNANLNKEVPLTLVFPTPASIQVKDGFYTIKSGTTYHFDQGFENSTFIESAFVTAFGKLKKSTSVASAAIKVEKKANLAEEAYTLSIGNEGIYIGASSSRGVFYAIQSLRSMLPLSQNTAVIRLPFVDIKDKPRFPYRGFMLDISRNFREKQTILKYLDAMAAYKLNVFHFHLIDDEGWRIEIPSLPELTEVGANRSPSFKNGNSIRPAYGSGATETGPHYLSRADYIEILKYAQARFITVIPEIETPGHARAAIKAMETRYNRLMAVGKTKEAEEYLLHDIEDQSIYNSVQNFNDNILNPAVPSVYTFINKVLEEFKSMYAEAGVEFTSVSLGGDEVPNGVWEGSPKIQQLMQEKGFTSIHQIWPYYIERINAICAAKGLTLAGWEEIGMVNKGNGMVVNESMPDKKNMQLDVWNNVIGGGHEDLAYRLANAGYPTVLISASNMYFDMMWNSNFTEPGFNWATYADLYHSFSLLPEDFFANIDTYYRGKPIGKEGFKNRIRLTTEGRKNMLGIKGGLFAETVHSEDKLDYMVFPRFFALAERAWSPKRDYEAEESFSIETFNTDYRKFLNRIGHVEMPRWADKIAFRLPAVGIMQDKDKLYANLEYPNFDIYYTTDGTTPSLKSMKYSTEQGVKFDAKKKYVFAVVDSYGRVGQLSYFN